MRTGMGWMFRELCRWEVGGRSGMVTDDSETFFPLVIRDCGQYSIEIEHKIKT